MNDTGSTPLPSSIVSHIAPVSIAGLSFIPPPWIPPLGEIFEGRVRGGDRWYRMRWLGWSRVDPSRALVQSLELGPRAYDILDGMRPVPWCP